MTRILRATSAALSAMVLFSSCGRADSTEDWPPTLADSVHDASTTASVKLALALEPGVRAIDIDVDTDRGTVTLRGEVGTEAERQLAAKITREVSGVGEVVNEIRVRS